MTEIAVAARSMQFGRAPTHGELQHAAKHQVAWNAGFRDPDGARRDPDLAPLAGDPEFERLYPDPAAKA